MECPKCGEYVDRSMFASDVTFCPFCGQNLKTPPPPPVTLSYCPYCGMELLQGARFCPDCGKNLVVKTKKKEHHPEDYSSSYDYDKSYKGPSFLKRSFDSIARFLTVAFSSERKMRRLYSQWAEYADLSPEEIKALEAQTEMSDEWKRRERLLKIIVLSGIALIIVIVVVALLVIYVF